MKKRAVQLGCEEGKVCRGRWGKVSLLGGKGRESVDDAGVGRSKTAVQLLAHFAA